MNNYRPPQQGYGPPPGQDPYARPGSTAYNQPPPGAPGYGSPVTQTPPWNGPPPNHQYNSYSSQNPLPPPPPGPPGGAGYHPHASYGGGQEVPPALPPRVSQQYGATSTPPNTGGYHPPGYGGPQAPGHSRLSSIPSAYQQEVSQNSQGWPQHPKYSNQPPTHNYEPPRPGQAPHQQPGPPQTYDPSPASSSVYSPDDPSHPQYILPSLLGQGQGHYAPPPPPPKPQSYAHGQAPSDHGQVYHGAPPANVRYSQGPSAQYGNQDESNQHAPYGVNQAPPPQDQGSYGQENTTQHGYPQQPPSQGPPRPYSNPQYAVSKPTLEERYPYPQPPGHDAPVSPLQTRQSISSINFERPGSTIHTGAPARSESQKSKHSSIFAPEVAPPPPKQTAASSFAFSSDWEHFGAGADEIDDTAMYGVKSDDKNSPKLASVELPGDTTHGRSSSDVSAPETSSWHPSPAIHPAPGIQHTSTIPSHPTPPPREHYTPTPPAAQNRMSTQRPPSITNTVVMDEADYIPPMPNTPPKAQRQSRAPITIGGAAQLQGPPVALGFVMDGGSWQPPAQSDPLPARGQEFAKPLSSLTQEAAGRPPLSNGLSNISSYTLGGASFTPAPLAPRAPSVDPELLKKARQEAEELKISLHRSENALEQLKFTLMEKESQITQKENLLAQKESVIAQKSAEITQKEYSISEKDSEIMQRTAHLKEVQSSLDEISENFNTLKTMTSDQEEQLQTAKTAHADLVEKYTQIKAELVTIKSTHETEKSDLDKKVTEAQISLAAAVAEVAELKKQIEAEKAKAESEKAKAEAKAAEPVDIAPGLNPWFKGSLERYKEMLYTEAKPIPIHEKLQVFQELVNSEARLRGIDMPFGPKGEVKGFAAVPQPPKQASPPQKKAQPVVPRLASPPKESEGFVMVEPESAGETQYSPGGRPILNAPVEQYSPGGRPIISTKAPSGPIASSSAPAKPPKEPPAGLPQKQSYQAFSIATPPLGSAATTPGSRGPSPMKPVEAQQPTQTYKPFTWNHLDQGEQARTGPVASPPVPPPSTSTSTPESSQGPAYKRLYTKDGWKASDLAPAPAAEAPKAAINTEIFMDHIPGMNLGKKRESITNLQAEAKLPGPLKPKNPGPPLTQVAELPASVTPPPREQGEPNTNSGTSSVEHLSSLLPSQMVTQPSKRVQELTKALDSFTTDYAFVKNLTKSWEDKAAVTRKNLERERDRRQAELEKRNNELYESGEIGYGDFDTLEAQAKEEELRSKAEEDAEEYQSYSKEVFDTVFKKVQDDISGLADIQSKAEAILRESSGGLNIVSNKPEDVNLSQAMSLLLKVHERLENSHAEVIKAVQERDRKYKLTQTKPLYAKGDAMGMKRVEKAFEEAEKKTDVRARVERAERCKHIWKIMDAEMERGAGSNEDYAADVLAAAEDAGRNVTENQKEELLLLVEKAKTVLNAVYEDTETLMQIFETVDMQLNECEYDVSVASAKLKGDGKEYFERLEVEKKREDGKLRTDGEKRINAVREHRKEAEDVLGDVVMGLKESKGEKEDRERKRMALEAARKRNGDA